MRSVVLEPFLSSYLGRMKNRVVMSPMSRGFADNDHCCTEAMKEYYTRRAKDGVALIISEGMIVHSSGNGYKNLPYMYTKKQAISWKETIDSVHQYGAKMFCQLWHCGRISNEDFTGGVTPVSSSDKKAEGIHRQNNKPYSAPRPLGVGEMPVIYDMFLGSAKLALDAGFDGIELHFGHGYLIDQFFDSSINNRDDAYGGKIENRCRFALELTERVIKEVSPYKVIVRISPSRALNGVYDWPDMDAMLHYLIPEFDKIGLRILDVSCARGDYYKLSGRVVRMIRPIWSHSIISGASLAINEAEDEITNGYIDMATWGRWLISNPDFVKKLKDDIPLISYDDSMLSNLC